MKISSWPAAQQRSLLATGTLLHLVCCVSLGAPQRVYFVPMDEMREWSAEAAHADFNETLDGFELRGHAPSPGLPGIGHVFLTTCLLLALVPMVLVFASMHSTRAFVWSILMLVGWPILWVMTSAPWVIVLVGTWVIAENRHPGRLHLQGRVLRTPTGQFTMGQPFQTLELARGNLVLETESERLVVRGCAAELLALKERLEQRFPGIELSELSEEAHAMRAAHRRHQASE